MNKAVVGFGSNIEPMKHLDKARLLLRERYSLLKESQFIKTEPIGDINQPDFINGVFLIQTSLSLPALKAELKEIESLLGRNHTDNRYAPRTVDLDIIIWNEKVIDNDLYRRDFLMKSTLEVYPDLIVPPQPDQRRQKKQ